MQRKMKNGVFRFQISVLVEKFVKYANQGTDDVIDTTQFYIKYINRAISVNLLQRPLKLGRLIVLQATHLR